jgi:hypothetical protein
MVFVQGLTMNDLHRGKIRNKEFAQQIKDYKGLRWGKITPTDIDAFADFNNKVFVFIECKHGSSSMPYGQRLALERLCDACEIAGIKSLVIVASHNVDCPNDIDISIQPVSLIRLNKEWRKPNTPQTVKSAIDGFLHWANNFGEKK